MGTMKYKGYTGSVDFSDEDNCLYGEVLGMSKDKITYEGTNVDELRKDFEGAVDDYIANCKADGIEPILQKNVAESEIDKKGRFLALAGSWNNDAKAETMDRAALNRK